MERGEPAESSRLHVSPVPPPSPQADSLTPAPYLLHVLSAQRRKSGPSPVVSWSGPRLGVRVAEVDYRERALRRAAAIGESITRLGIGSLLVGVAVGVIPFMALVDLGPTPPSWMRYPLLLLPVGIALMLVGAAVRVTVAALGRA